MSDNTDTADERLERIREMVDSWPPLTGAQLDALRLILRPVATEVMVSAA